MIKRQELSDPKSCLNKARDDEFLFVLLERDKVSPRTIRFWVAERINEGLNEKDDPQMREALECARRMEIARENSK
jgi:hypothetical protein